MVDEITLAHGNALVNNRGALLLSVLWASGNNDVPVLSVELLSPDNSGSVLLGTLVDDAVGVLGNGLDLDRHWLWILCYDCQKSLHQNADGINEDELDLHRCKAGCERAHAHRKQSSRHSVRVHHR